MLSFSYGKYPNVINLPNDGNYVMTEPCAGPLSTRPHEYHYLNDKKLSITEYVLEFLYLGADECPVESMH
jgi:hypothetical protein